MGEISGQVIDEEDKMGKSRMLVNIKNINGNIVTKIITESDGYFSYFGLRPGTYSVSIDSTQLKVLNLTADCKTATITPNINGSYIDVGEIILRHAKPVVKEVPETKLNVPVLETKPNVTVPDMKPTENVGTKLVSLDSLLRVTMLFDFNKTAVKSEYNDFIKKLAQFLQLHDCAKVEIEGHTDSFGTKSYNDVLSAKRAKAVMNQLVTNGVNKSQLVVKGCGKDKPLNGNKTPKERTMNRRVQFKNISDKDCPANGSIKK
jgi:outer membrane protein OmpA-like peptidoglycan-associated protein